MDGRLLGEVRIADDKDFLDFKQACLNHGDGWEQKYNKHGTVVYAKLQEASSVKLLKVSVTFKKVCAATLYDVLHDPEYRKMWDPNMIDAYEICQLNPNNDVGYYSWKCSPPLKNRDFVTLRSWLETGTEYMIINHSVNHQKVPPKKGFVRGISLLSGYLIRPLTSDSCHFTYLTQMDPRGSLPKWVVNKATQFYAPRMMQKIHKAAMKYPAWKSQHKPAWKPWLYPEQITVPRVNYDDLSPVVLAALPDSSSDIMEEMEALEEDFKDENFVKDEDTEPA
ncbi:START domain-containing protein 10-like [Branchiostoma floridae]|uniref:START domain-containing protein 10 n=1 Tax=Branchiostoma floridae TaxID=7739 RepID=A0A9J7LHQ4_BRAFL|nr:START domain-containing protein 10-like [Branchiostoma floridae]